MHKIPNALHDIFAARIIFILDINIDKRSYENSLAMHDVCILLAGISYSFAHTQNGKSIFDAVKAKREIARGSSNDLLVEEGTASFALTNGR